MDYVKIKSEHPSITLITPDELRKSHQSGEDKFKDFDAVISFSSLEHSGLGRYGDGLNPWGDLVAMAQAWCLVRPGGRALVGIPTGSDWIRFNAGRIYGPFQLSHLFANWKQVFTKAKITPLTEEREGPNFAKQPIFILEKGQSKLEEEEEKLIEEEEVKTIWKKPTKSRLIYQPLDDLNDAMFAVCWIIAFVVLIVLYRRLKIDSILYNYFERQKYSSTLGEKRQQK